MNASSSLGRRVFGVAVVPFGILTLIWPGYYDWLTLRHFLDARECVTFAYVASVAQIVGGVAIQFARTMKIGALALGATYLAIALLGVPHIVAKPLVYDNWGNFFEQFSLATGAGILYARTSSWRVRARRAASVLFGICTASFTLEQAIYLAPTASLVPKWLPPSQMFWAIATCVPLGLAAVALIIDRQARLASRLLTIMLASFGIIVWVPLLLASPHSHFDWSETIETFSITGAAWVLADGLAERARPTMKV